ncbi:hypothetical protein VTN31DRAFT_6906 [Thermomyces dupontii]|uniref:uncharacterized protein n=1 Tax=Talaromyces thermophilus TaxID=28565 RepID=UPI003743A18C
MALQPPSAALWTHSRNAVTFRKPPKSLLNWFTPSSRRRRHDSSTKEPPPKKRIFLRATLVAVAAAAVGAYIRSRQDAGNPSLNPHTFAHYRLVSREPVSSTNSIFTLEPNRPADNAETYQAAWRAGIWSVLFKQPQLQIGRDYTPLPPSPDAGNDRGKSDDESLRFLIRREPHGEVSRYLHSLPIGSEIEIRGPQLECEIDPNVDHILFIAGGTGIAPALQAAYTLLSRTKDGRRPRMHILWANRKREDCLGGVSDTTTTQVSPKTPWWKFWKAATPQEPQPVKPSDSEGVVVRELQALKAQYPGQITVDYFVDEEHTFITKKDIQSFTNSVAESGPSKKMIIISGPDGFVSYMAGPKMWAQGRELQGPVRGLFGELDLRGWAVWKL